MKAPSLRSLCAAVVLVIVLSLAAIANPLIAGPSPAAAAGPTVTITPNMVTVGSTAIVHGTGFTPGSQALVFWQRPDLTTRSILIATSGSGMFSFRLGFALRHGTGTEFVAARDPGTNTQSPSVTVTVHPLHIVAMGKLSASPNPVMRAGTTRIVGTGFLPNSRVLVRWSRPDGTHTFVEVIANMAGAFAFRVVANPAHGCGARVFVAIDLITGTQSLPLSLAESC
jgi:hypothetical protein